MKPRSKRSSCGDRWSPRLRAEELKLRHADWLYPFLSTDLELYRYIPTRPPASLDRLRARFSKLVVGRSPDHRERWLNWVLFRDDEIVGTLEATVRESEGIVLIAYSMFAAHRRQGFATEALRALIEVLFERFAGVETVQAFVDDQNEASRRLAKRVGMTQVRTIPDADFFDGKSRTEILFVLTREEHKSRFATPPS